MKLFPWTTPITASRQRVGLRLRRSGKIETHFLAKQPGPRMRLGPAVMTFRYADSFQTANNLEAYERLILERCSATRNSSPFRRHRAPMGDRYAGARRPAPVEFYAPGSWGPVSIDRIVSPERWSLPR